MNKTIVVPRSLIEAVRYFSDLDVANTFLAALRWPEGPVCPRCHGKEHSFLKTRRLWKCKECQKQFSVKVGTIFEDSPIGLDKWLPALWMLVNAKNGISSYELAKALLVTQKSAWFMLHRVRLAMQSQWFVRLDGEIEADETFIGGKARNMHADQRKKKIGRNKGPRAGKVAVMGLLQRHGPGKMSQVRTDVVPNVRRGRLHWAVYQNVEPGATIYTDQLSSYRGLEANYIHKVINHAESYVEGKVHVNGIENFWSLLKRSIKGTYVSVEPFHLFRYLDEQAFRFNQRRTKDVARFVDAVRNIVGKRLTYNTLTGVAATT